MNKEQLERMVEKPLKSLAKILEEEGRVYFYFNRERVKASFILNSNQLARPKLLLSFEHNKMKPN